VAYFFWPPGISRLRKLRQIDQLLLDCSSRSLQYTLSQLCEW